MLLSQPPPPPPSLVPSSRRGLLKDVVGDDCELRVLFLLSPPEQNLYARSLMAASSLRPHLNNFSFLLLLLVETYQERWGEEVGGGGGVAEGKRERARLFYGRNSGANSPPKMPTLRFPTIESTQGVDLEIHFSHSANIYYGDAFQLITAPTPPTPTLSPFAMPAPLSDPSSSNTTQRHFQTLRFPPSSWDPRFALQPPARRWVKQSVEKPFSFSLPRAEGRFSAVNNVKRKEEKKLPWFWSLRLGGGKNACIKIGGGSWRGMKVRGKKERKGERKKTKIITE